MYFEARTHQLRPVRDAHEAAKIVKEGPQVWSEVLTWQGKTHEMLCVADGHLNNMFLEVAMLRKEPDGSYLQVESITAGWVNSTEHLAKLFLQAETALPVKRVQLIIGEPQGHEQAWFTCGCCGNDFKDSVKKQIAFDQDAGYGICPRCQ
jgi:hypothetical protein